MKKFIVSILAMGMVSTHASLNHVHAQGPEDQNVSTQEVIEAQSTNRSCKEKLKDIVYKRGNISHRILLVGTSVVMTFPLWAGVAYALPAVAGLAAVGGAVEAVSLISLNSAVKSLRILEQAEAGNGLELEELWFKFNKQFSERAGQISFDEFVTAIHKSDLDGSACLTKRVPKKRDYFKQIK